MLKALFHASTAVFVLAITLYCSPQAIAQVGPGVTQSAAQTAAVTGTVVQSDGTPVAGATLRLSGPSARLTAASDVHGTFIFTSVPYGTYNIDASAANLGVASHEGIVVKGDINVAIQYAAPASGIKQIAHVTTNSAGAQINVTPANIASVTPSNYAFQGNVSWLELLNQIPGVTVGGAMSNGTSESIPDSPFIPIVLSINGSQPYETATSMDGMPLFNRSFFSVSGGGVNLSSLPMPLFETADVVRGPGANAPSIVDSVGGSFVLHAPSAVDKNSFQASFSNDAYGGYYSNMKLTFRLGNLSGTMVYGFNNSPGPIAGGPVFGTPGSPTMINGSVVAGGGFVTAFDPVVGNFVSGIQQTALVGTGGFESSEWSQHNGGIGLSYQLAPSTTVQMLYIGSQAVTALAPALNTVLFTPDPSYGGPLAPGAYTGQTISSASTPLLQSESLLEEKITSYLGRGVVRLAALQNYTNITESISSLPPTAMQLFGTGNFCANSACTITTPFVFTGQMATVTYAPLTFAFGARTVNDDFLSSYETQLGSNSYAGISITRSIDSCFTHFAEHFSAGAFQGGIPPVKQTLDELRLHAGTQLTDRLLLDGSYYIARGDFHVPNPSNQSQHIDSIFPYSAPRVGLTWRTNRDTVVRASAGGGFALPPIINLVGANSVLPCGPTFCTEIVTNINLQPEKSFGIDIGTDMRLQPNTTASLDFYKTDLYGQFFQSVSPAGTNPINNLPIFAQQFQNLGHSRFEGINLALRHDVPHGMYWNIGLGLTRGYIVSVPAGFYNTLGGTCNVATGANCQNTSLIVGPNFNGGNRQQTLSTVPYANGSGKVGYRWNSRKYADFEINYFGNNNAYFQPAFLEFNAHGSYPLTKTVTLLAAFRNLTGIHDQTIGLLTVNDNFVGPTIAPFEFPFNAAPYGPRTVTVTANFQL